CRRDQGIGIHASQPGRACGRRIRADHRVR
ncbi:hypothetical protein AZ037_005599, partial [Klebsiella michiganensis]